MLEVATGWEQFAILVFVAFLARAVENIHELDKKLERMEERLDEIEYRRSDVEY